MLMLKSTLGVIIIPKPKIGIFLGALAKVNSEKWWLYKYIQTLGTFCSHHWSLNANL